MTIQLIMDNVNIPVKHIRFSDGASNVELDIPEGFKPSRYASITVDPSTPCDNVIQELLLVGNAVALNTSFCGKLILNLPYLPYARGDRKFVPGNPHPLDVFFGCIEQFMGKVEIHLTDPHSDFYKEYQDYFSFVVKPQWDRFIEVAGKDIKSGDVLIAPDKGALSKIYLLQDALKLRKIDVEVVEAGKKRDITTGRIIETTLPESVDLVGKRCFIVDDLLDAGGTFIPLAEKLKEIGATEVSLYITHGIFAKGLGLFKGILDRIYCYQTVSNYVTMMDIDNFNSGKEVK
jgi:ribose-phosphate pyrophosphokinase